MENSRYIKITRMLKILLVYLCLFSVILTFMICEGADWLLVGSAVAVCMCLSLLTMIIRSNFKDEGKNLRLELPYFLCFAFSFIYSLIVNNKRNLRVIVIHLAVVSLIYLVNLYMANFTYELLKLNSSELATFKAHASATHGVFRRCLTIIAILFMFAAVIPFSGVGKFAISAFKGGSMNPTQGHNYTYENEYLVDQPEMHDATEDVIYPILGKIVLAVMVIAVVWSAVWLIRLIWISFGKNMTFSSEGVKEYSIEEKVISKDIKGKKRRFEFYSRDPEKIVRKTFKNAAFLKNDDNVNENLTPSELLKEKNIDSNEYELRALYEKARYSKYECKREDADYAKTLYTKIKKAHA